MTAGLALAAAAALLPGPRVALAGPGVAPVGGVSLPVPAGSVTAAALRAPHHDYPASDLMVPAGTPVFAAHPGRVRVHGGAKCGRGVTVVAAGGWRSVSCHLSVVSVRAGVRVRAGDVLGLSGDTGNARGVPHLHFHLLDRAGRHVCPQAFLLAWREGRRPPPGAWNVREGCFF